MTTFRAGGASDVGQIRSNNQDSKLIIDDVSVFAVADGMGGHQGGEVASAIAVETLEAVITEPTVDSVVEAVKEANRRIFSRAADDDDLRGMGTTLVAIALVNRGAEDEEVAWVNVGDSRVYLLRDDRLVQLSRDHSLVEDLRRGGQLSEEEAAVHPQRNILTRALGIDEAVQVDTDSVMPFNGDRFLLCSDGLFNEVDPDTIVEVLTSSEDPDASAAELVRLANEGGGRDNITALVVDVTDDSGRSARAAEAAAAAAARAEAGIDDEATGDDEAAAPDGASPTVDTVETPATQGDPAIADVDPTPPAGLPVSPGTSPVQPADSSAHQAATDDAVTGPAPPPLPPAESTDDVTDDATADAAGPPPTPSAPGPDEQRATDDEELPFGRGTTDVFEDLERQRGRHKVTIALVALVVLAALLGGAYAAGSYWANDSYYLAADPAGTVQIYRGRPGGFLIFDPTLERADPTVTLEDLDPDRRREVEAHKEFASLRDANTWLNTRGDEIDSEQATTTTTTPASTTTEAEPTGSSASTPATSPPSSTPERRAPSAGG